VQHALHLGLDDGAAGHRGQQDTAQRVAERVAEAALQRLEGNPRVTGPERLHVDDARLQKFGDGIRHG
jgi:hypothetical protein